MAAPAISFKIDFISSSRMDSGQPQPVVPPAAAICCQESFHYFLDSREIKCQRIFQLSTLHYRVSGAHLQVAGDAV
jgi:hypothetical protein